MSRRPEGSKCQVRVTLKFLQVSKRATMRKSLASEATKKARKRLRPSIYSLCGAVSSATTTTASASEDTTQHFGQAFEPWGLLTPHGTIFFMYVELVVSTTSNICTLGIHFDEILTSNCLRIAFVFRLQSLLNNRFLQWSIDQKSPEPKNKGYL